ncbi:hypothetical protein K470DRAFT_29523 [Piedraia hortae CBS 480.64]|uniref:Uncharacterized protein n=1 Tax=Piedraia hortae CBS 480.64 TaxID=1314780 RepID=A0A6A7C3Y3_9PEZI|nr:hypothetical protein K470DRAFT_29523 [Piedraia hortae CBS 480.64]
MSEISFPIISIPVYYVLSIVPHAVALNLSAKGNPKGRHDNRNPKSTTMQETLRQRLSARDFAAFERAESCHRNSLENMPLYVAAVLAGVLAEKKAGAGSVGLSNFCVMWHLIRLLYTANYIMTETIRWSYLRSLLYFAGTGYAFATLYKSARVLA